jgi:hypothetical protein
LAQWLTALEAELPAVYFETREMKAVLNRSTRRIATMPRQRRAKRPQELAGIQNVNVVRANKATCEENTNAP